MNNYYFILYYEIYYNFLNDTFILQFDEVNTYHKNKLDTY